MGGVGRSERGDGWVVKKDSVKKFRNKDKREERGGKRWE